MTFQSVVLDMLENVGVPEEILDLLKKEVTLPPAADLAVSTLTDPRSVLLGPTTGVAARGAKIAAGETAIVEKTLSELRKAGPTLTKTIQQTYTNLAGTKVTSTWKKQFPNIPLGEVLKANKLLNKVPPGFLKRLVTNPVVITTGVFGLLAVSGQNAAAVWLASDNLQTQLSIASNQLAKEVESGFVSVEEGLVLMDRVQTRADATAAFIRKSVALNPIFWLSGSGRIFNANSQELQETINTNRGRVERGGIGGTFAGRGGFEGQEGFEGTSESTEGDQTLENTPDLFSSLEENRIEGEAQIGRDIAEAQNRAERQRTNKAANVRNEKQLALEVARKKEDKSRRRGRRALAFGRI